MMVGWKWQRPVWMIVAFILYGATAVDAADLLPKPGTWATGFRSGYSVSPRKVDMVPVHVRLGYTLFKGQKWLFPPGALELNVEPFASVITRVTNPGRREGSMELGIMLPVVTYYFDLSHWNVPYIDRFVPYIEGGLGMLYTDLRGYGLGGHFSFAETVGVGMAYCLDDNMTFNLGWRFRHMSNAGIYESNSAVNSYMFLAGFTYFLPGR